MPFLLEGQPVHKAWADAMEHMRNNARKNYWSADFSCDLLMKVIQFQSAWSLSGCGVEQLVAHQHQLFNKHRKKATSQRWVDECNILCSQELGVSDAKIGEKAW